MDARRLLSFLAAAALLVAVGLTSASWRGDRGPLAQQRWLGSIRHFVVIYQENHSFDNLFGGWEGVNGVASADAAHTVQVAPDGRPYRCLAQTDVNLTVPPLSVSCSAHSHFPNAPFVIDASIPAGAKTCPAPGVAAPNGVRDPHGKPGGCTRDLVHRFYQEQYQLHRGRQDRYATGSDAVGLTQGIYDTRRLPIYRYLHRPGHPRYVVADNLFQAAFGGSFLNHQWLVSATTPTFAGAAGTGPNNLHSIVDANGMPISYPLYRAQGRVADQDLTARCPSARPGLLCGDFAVNTIQPAYQPFLPGTRAAKRLPPLTNPTIGERLSAKGIDWAWYAGGWSNAAGEIGAPGWSNGEGPRCSDPGAASNARYPYCPDKLFQFHHQPLNYFAAYAPATRARAVHLRDEREFVTLAATSRRARCALKPVSFVKPIGADNEHPGYASQSAGSTHLVDLIEAIENSTCAPDTMVIVTYDEFGGAWDHVAPPGQPGGRTGPSDQSGPGTRIPALILAPNLPADFSVDPTEHDTTSILATLEHRFALTPLGARDSTVADLTSIFTRANRR